MKAACGLVLAAALLAGCGGHEQSAAEKAANARFADLDYEMSNVELSAPPFQENLGRLTQRYIALTRKYADVLGDDEVKKRLADKSDEVAPYCLPCSGTLDRERERY